MSLARRLEIFLGGPARDFPLTVREADQLASGLDALIEEFQMESLRDGGSPEDPDVIESFVDLRARLRAFCGFTKGLRGR